MKEKFREFGRIVDIALKDGYGFIEFEDPHDAGDCIREMHRRDVFGNGILTVQPARSRRYGPGGDGGGGGGGRGGGGGYGRGDRDSRGGRGGGNSRDRDESRGRGGERGGGGGRDAYDGPDRNFERGRGERSDLCYNCN